MKKLYYLLFFLVFALLIINHKAKADINDDFIEFARYGTVAQVDSLLKLGANIEYKSKYDGTALMAACTSGNYDIARLLIENKANMKTSGPYFKNILLAAAKSCNIELCQLLLNHDFNLNELGSDSSNVIDYSSLCDVKLVELFLKKGANPNILRNDGFTPLMNPIFNDGLLGHIAHKDVFELLLKFGADPNKTLPSKDSPLLLAVSRNQLEYVELLLKHGAKVETRNIFGQTALEFAKAKGSTEIVKALKAAGAKEDTLLYNGAEWFTCTETDSNCVDKIKFHLSTNYDIIVSEVVCKVQFYDENYNPFFSKIITAKIEKKDKDNLMTETIMLTPPLVKKDLNFYFESEYHVGYEILSFK